MEPNDFKKGAACFGKGAAYCGRGIKKGIGNLIGKVNPNVWREAAYVSMLSYSLVLPRREQVTDRESDSLVPIVFVHGLGGNRGTMFFLRSFLQLHGHSRMYAFGYEDGTIEGHAADLKTYIKQVLETTGEPRVDVVAHSLGGVISRYAIQRLGMAKKVRTLVTMATPHQGTWSAHYANTTLTLPLRPDSALMKDLNADSLKKFPTRFVCIYSDRDMYIVPKEMMTHPDAENIFVPDVAHTQHLLCPRVFRTVEGCLA